MNTHRHRHRHIRRHIHRHRHRHRRRLAQYCGNTCFTLFCPTSLIDIKCKKNRMFSPFPLDSLMLALACAQSSVCAQSSIIILIQCVLNSQSSFSFSVCPIPNHHFHSVCAQSSIIILVLSLARSLYLFYPSCCLYVCMRVCIIVCQFKCACMYLCIKNVHDR